MKLIKPVYYVEAPKKKQLCIHCFNLRKIHNIVYMN